MEILAFVGGLWALYIGFLWRHFDSISKIHENILKSWTGARPTTTELVSIDQTPYARFCLRDYKKVPSVFKVTRRHLASYKWTLFTGGCLNGLFLLLGFYTARVAWNALESKAGEIAEQQAQIVVAGHILLFFTSAGVLAFFRYLEGVYSEHYFVIDTEGLRSRIDATPKKTTSTD